jgi:hypothetical protein
VPHKSRRSRPMPPKPQPPTLSTSRSALYLRARKLGCTDVPTASLTVIVEESTRSWTGRGIKRLVLPFVERT